MLYNSLYMLIMFVFVFICETTTAGAHASAIIASGPNSEKC